MLRIEVFCASDHSIMRTAARPRIRVLTFTFFGVIRALFIRNTISAVVLGLVGSHE